MTLCDPKSTNNKKQQNEQIKTKITKKKITKKKTNTQSNPLTSKRNEAKTKPKAKTKQKQKQKAKNKSNNDIDTLECSPHPNTPSKCQFTQKKQARKHTVHLNRKQKQNAQKLSRKNVKKL